VFLNVGCFCLSYHSSVVKVLSDQGPISYYRQSVCLKKGTNLPTLPLELYFCSPVTSASVWLFCQAQRFGLEVNCYRIAFWRIRFSTFEAFILPAFSQLVKGICPTNLPRTFATFAGSSAGVPSDSTLGDWLSVFIDLPVRARSAHSY
jgi:hypothetical protein